MSEERKRSIVKGLTWRLLASSATVAIVFIFTGSLKASFGVSLSEIVVKTSLYYLHERIWDRVSWGRAGA